MIFLYLPLALHYNQSYIYFEIKIENNSISQDFTTETRKGNGMYYYFAVLKKYADFTDRARRQQYWMFTLFNAIITTVLDIIDSITEVPVLVGLYTCWLR